MRTLLIDDIRDIEATVIARNYDDGIYQLQYNGPWDLLLLDHDLASYDQVGREKTGYDVMCWLENNAEFFPSKIRCVSANPVGKQRIEAVIRKYLNI